MLYTADLLRRIMGEYRDSCYCLAESAAFCFLVEYDRDKLSKSISDLITGLSAYDTNYQIEPSIGIYRTENNLIPIETMTTFPTPPFFRSAIASAESSLI